MHSLEAITAACKQAVEDEADGQEWQYVYAQTVDPESVLELVTLLDGQETLPSNDELQALGKMVRDLMGYLRFKTGIASDPVRDDLMQHANQLLALTGL